MFNCLSGCLFVSLSCHSEITMKGGVRRSDFVRLGLIAWLRELMSRGNPSSRSTSSPEVEEKLCSFSPHARWPGEAFLDQVGIGHIYPSQ